MKVKTLEEMRRENARKYLAKIKNLKKDNPNESRKFAIKELIKIGLFTSDGKPKETIVSLYFQE